MMVNNPSSALSKGALEFALTTFLSTTRKMNPSLLFTLFLILTSYATLPASGANLFEELCKKVKENGSDEGRCLQILKADPKLASAKNYGDLSKYILEFALKKSIEGRNYLKEVMKTNPSSAAIKECATFDYDGVVGSFKSALGELKEDSMTANYDAKVGGDGPTTCDRALAAEKINNPAISALDKEIFLLSNLAFLATNMLP